MRTRSTLVMLVVIAALLTGCGRGAGTETPVVESPSPTPVEEAETEPESPVETPAFSSPLTSESPQATPSPGTLFAPKLDTPIRVGNTEICGTGPRGLPIELYEVGKTGNHLGSGTIDEDGQFCIDLETELQAGQRVGLAIGELEGTRFTRDELKELAIINLPVIGLLFDDVTVETEE